MPKLAERLRVVDADSHMTERHDLFTARAPKGFEDKVPHVEQVDGMAMWMIDGRTFGKAGSGGTIDHDRHKQPFADSQGGSWGIDDVHPAAWNPEERLRLMDEIGIDAQVLYPNSMGLGGQNLYNTIEDKVVVQLCVELYNDAMAEVQEASANRLLPCRSCRHGTSRGVCVRHSAVPTGDAESTLQPTRRTPVRPTWVIRPGTRSGRFARAKVFRCISTSAPARRH